MAITFDWTHSLIIHHTSGSYWRQFVLCLFMHVWEVDLINSFPSSLSLSKPHPNIVGINSVSPFQCILGQLGCTYSDLSLRGHQLHRKTSHSCHCWRALDIYRTSLSLNFGNWCYPKCSRETVIFSLVCLSFTTSISTFSLNWMLN